MAGRSVTVSLRGNVAQYNASMASAAAATEAAMGRASAATSRHQALWRASSAAVKYGALTAAGGLAVTIKASADFEARMANVRTLSKANRTEMDALRKSALNAGTGYGYTANQVADAQTEMIKAGVSLKNIMGGGLRGTLALAAAGQIDVADATTIAASAMTQFGLAGRDLPHVADLLAAGADKALGSVGDLGYGLSQAGTQAHQMGISVEDTVGTLAEFAQAGLIGERGGTAFKQMLLRLASPSKQAKKLMDQYGVSLYDANGQMKSMPEVAGNLTRSFKDMEPAQRNAALATIFGTHAIQAANILIAGGEKGNRKWIKSVNDQGFAAEQASGKLDSLKGDFQKLKAVGENALIEIGSGSQSPLRGLVQNITGDIAKITRNGDLKRWSADIGHDLQAIITASGPLAHSVGDALGVVSHGIGKVVAGFNALPKGVQSALVTGGAVAYGAHKLGLDSLATTLVRGGTGKGVGGLGGMAKGVTPVVVTNWPAGFGAPGGPIGGPVGRVGGTPIIGAPMTRGARLASALDRGARSPLTFAALEVGALAVHNLAPQRHFASGALAGAGWGAMLGGPLGAGAGALIGGSASYLRSLQKNKPTKFDADMAAPTSQSEKLAKSYAELYKAQEKIRRADPKGFQDALKVPGEASQNAYLLSRTLQKMGEVTGHTVTSQQALKMALGDTGRSAQRAGGLAQKSMYDLGGLTRQTAKAGISAGATARMFHSLPKYVQTKIQTPGALQSQKAIKALGRQFGLTPKQIRAIITLVGARDAQDKTKATQRGLRTLNTTSAKPKVFAETAPAQAKIKSVDRGLRTLNQTTAKPKVFAQDNASGTIGHIKGEINSIPKSRTSTITVNHVENFTINRHVNTSANKPRVFDSNTAGATGGLTTHGRIVPRGYDIGGRVTGPGTGSSDDVPAWLSNGEYVIRASAVQRYGVGMFDRLNAMKMAVGGTVGGKGAPAVLTTANHVLTAAQRELNVADRYRKKRQGETKKAHEAYIKSVKHMATELSKTTDKLKAARDARKEYAGTVSQAFVSDPFGGTLGGFRGQVGYETKKLRGVKADLTTLKANGLSGSLYKDLAASGNATLIDQFAQLSRAQIAAEERRYATRNRLDQQVGVQAANAVYIGKIAQLTAETRHLRDEFHQLRTGHHIGNHTTNIGKVVGKDAHDAVKKAHRTGARAVRNLANR